MVQLGYDSDDEDGLTLEPAKQKFAIRKPVTPYVCSTPCDFDDERKFLAQEIFPQLEDLCRQRGTAFSMIDVQWKPDSLQTESGHLLRINLDFIMRCSPYFICLLGETYGPHRTPDDGKLPDSLHSLPEDASWIDKNCLVAASAGYSWILKEVHQNCSIPELEIIQAAFLSDNRYCHFYYRQPEHLDHKLKEVAVSEKEDFIALHKPESEYADLNIRDLKQRIVNKGLPVKYFQTCVELGAHVLRDWKEVIDELYPPLLDSLGAFDTEEYREWLCHEVFSESRRHIYLNHSELRTLKSELTKFCRSVLDEPGLEQDEDFSHTYKPHSVSNELRKKPAVVVKHKSIFVLKADRGMGKSSLVSNWVKQFGAEHAEVKVISHFVGCSGRSRDITTFLRKCILELREEYLTEDDNCESDGEVARQNFKELCGSFQSAISLGPCVLLIDGVDELGASLELSPQEIKDFSWIPLPLPPQCRIVVTTLNSDLSYGNLMKRPDTKFMSLSNLNTTKVKAEMLEDHMQMHFEHLKRMHLQTIFESKLSGRPLFLRILGNEMCAYSVYTDIDVYTETIRDMCTSIRDLFVRCFRRWSQDHSWTYEVLSAEQTESDTVDFIGWVPDVLRLLAVSRSGLTANEILDILVAMGYQENVKVTQFDWLMFQLCMGDNITQSPYGMLNFSHQHMREIVEYVLLRIVKPSTAEIISHTEGDKEWKKQKREFSQHLVHYFQGQGHSQRCTEELPWQLLMSADMKGLAEIVAEPQMFESLYDAGNRYPSNHYDLRRYWYYLEREGYSPADTYSQLLTRLGVLKPEPDKIEVESVEDNASVSDISETSSTGKEQSVPPIMLFSTVSPNIPSIFTTPAVDHKLSVIEEASDVMSKDDRSSVGDLTNGGESVFLTQAGETEENRKYDLSPAEVTVLTWHVSQFILELGYKQAGEAILMALNSRLMKPEDPHLESYPLSETDQLIHAKVQECLGQLYLDLNNLDLADKWYRKALRTIMDMPEMEESSSMYTDLQHLKGKIIQQIGCLRLQEGLLDDADDLLDEALDLAEATHKLTARATVLLHIGTLRMQQQDYLMAETNLRKSLMLRQKWYGRNHTLVADILFKLGILMADENNDRGFDRAAASDAFRRCLEIREFHLDKDHVQVADVLFELGKLLKHETSYCGRTECNSLLTRALDIRITQLGGDHIETRAVRQYLNNLEVSLKSAKHDIRSSERPYSSLSWRSQDLANIEKKSRLQSGKSSSYGQVSRPGSQLSRAGSHMSRTHSQNVSRPVSGQMDFSGAALSQKNNMMSYLPASERIMLESSNTPRLLQRETVHRKLKQKETISPQISPHTEQKLGEEKKQVSEEVELDHEKKIQEVPDGVLLDSFGVEGDKSGVKFETTMVPLRKSPEEPLGRETPPQRLYRRYGSPENMVRSSGQSAFGTRSGEVVLRTSQMSPVSRKESSLRHKRPVGSARSARSARSVGSSLYTSASGMSVASHKTNCDIPRGPHSLHISNARSTTMGPHSSVISLMGDRGPKDISREIHHKSAWYHVPGRYSTLEKNYAPKRSQKREEAKRLEKSVSPVAPDPYVTFMRSDYRKNNPKMLYKGYPGKDGHTCCKGQTYVPYPRNDKKQYVICDQCRKETEEIILAKENEMLALVERGDPDEVMLAPTVNGLAAPDRPRQASFVLEEPIVPDDYGTYQNTGSMVTFKDTVVIN